MKTKLIAVGTAALLLTPVFYCIYRKTGAGAALPPAITFGTIAYHIWMRLGVGLIINALMKNKADYTKRWYQIKPWEAKLYQKLKVKRWKKLLPTFDEAAFDISKHSLSEVAGAMCQAEVVHEIITVLSFVPILFSIKLGALPVFVVTSIAAACLDMMFVIIQRYNRPRVLKLI